ncbi:ACDE family multidrug resistance protein [Oikeobacillus pervagus]|uniref:ACDE family multidrug resistance protein n=1 Tax=Oikeobacillus pervagus TaxID=1325931 RepID=A0AAJ1WFF7_9BACI|nr:MFS transporter [Oikeobacillus pervagus]MDQ0213887.1 ACDE family multidrug resistance protein [Oikeobacillus pervagus]
MSKPLFYISLLPFIMVLGNSMMIPILPDMQSELHLTEKESGYILSFFSFPAAIIIPFIGFLSDRFGRKILILLSLFFVIGGSVLCAVSIWFPHPFIWLLIGRVIQGIGAAGTTPLAMAIIGDAVDRTRQGEAFGLLEVFNGVGKVVAPIVGATAAAIYNWNLAFVFVIIVTVLSLVGIFKTIPNKKSGNQVNSIRNYLQDLIYVLKSKWLEIFPLFYMGAVGLFLLFGILFYLSYYIEMTYHIDGFFKGTAFMFPLAAMTIVSYWTGKQLKNSGNFQSLTLIGISVMMVSFAGMEWNHSFHFFLFFLTIAFAGLGFILPCMNTAITSQVSDGERGFIVGLYGTARFIGVALGPTIFSIWIDDVGYMIRIVFILSFSMLLAFIFHQLIMKETQPYLQK